jgi:NADH-quinone oxidoreductase subunit G
MGFTDITQLRALLQKSDVKSGQGLAVIPEAADGFERISSSPIYRVDAVSKRAGALQAHPLTLGAQLVLHPEDAQKIGLSSGQIAKVGDGTGSAALPVALSEKVAPGCVWIESNYAATAPLSQTTTLAIVRAAL